MTTDTPAPTPRRIAIVRANAFGLHQEDMGDGRTSRACTVTLPRLPWEPEVTQPDPRVETAPRVGSIRNPNLDETCGPYAPARPLRR